MNKTKLIILLSVIAGLLIISLLVNGQSWHLPPTPELPAIAAGDHRQKLHDAFQQEVTQLLNDYDQELARIHQALQASADQKWDEYHQELEAEFTQSIAGYQEQLEVEAQQFAMEMKQLYQIPLLNLELRLLIVSLSEQERGEVVEKIQQLRQELRQAQKDKELEFQQRLSQYEQEEQARLSDKLSEFETQLEAQVTQEYVKLREELHAQLDQEIARREDALRRAVRARE